MQRIVSFCMRKQFILWILMIQRMQRMSFVKLRILLRSVIPELFPDARVLLLWNVTLGFTTVDLMVHLQGIEILII